MKFNTIRLLVGDFPASFDFWTNVMQLPLAFGGTDIAYPYFKQGDAGLELYGRDAFAEVLGEPTPAPAPTGHRAVVILAVDNVDQSYAELVERGAVAVVGPADRPVWEVRTAHLRDPEGNIIELYRRLG